MIKISLFIIAAGITHGLPVENSYVQTDSRSTTDTTLNNKNHPLAAAHSLEDHQTRTSTTDKSPLPSRQTRGTDSNNENLQTHEKHSSDESLYIDHIPETYKEPYPNTNTHLNLPVTYHGAGVPDSSNEHPLLTSHQTASQSELGDNTRISTSTDANGRQVRDTNTHSSQPLTYHKPEAQDSRNDEVGRPHLLSSHQSTSEPEHRGSTKISSSTDGSTRKVRDTNSQLNHQPLTLQQSGVQSSKQDETGRHSLLSSHQTASGSEHSGSAKISSSTDGSVRKVRESDSQLNHHPATLQQSGVQSSKKEETGGHSLLSSHQAASGSENSGSEKISSSADGSARKVRDTDSQLNHQPATLQQSGFQSSKNGETGRKPLLTDYKPSSQIGHSGNTKTSAVSHDNTGAARNTNIHSNQPTTYQRPAAQNTGTTEAGNSHH